MPLIEELPVTSTVRASHGWTYVPDTAAPIPAVHLGSRKRGRDGNIAPARSAHFLSAKQEKAIQQRLSDLNKENYRDANIPIPKRDGAKAHEKKQTSNVKRILAYSRTFQHYLANEEAGINPYGSAANVSSSTARGSIQAAQAPPKTSNDSKRKSIAAPVISTPAPKGGTRRASSLRQSRTASVKTEREGGNNKPDIEMADAEPLAQSSPPSSPTASQKSPKSSRQKQPAPSPSSVNQTPAPPYDPALDRDPLLRTRDLPKPPSDRVMEALLAEAPLSYVAARAQPLEDPTNESGSGTAFAMRAGNSALMAKPGRWFCAVCGYWGKVRCKYGCGERVCGLLECWRGHETVCTLAATAY